MHGIKLQGASTPPLAKSSNAFSCLLISFSLACASLSLSLRLFSSSTSLNSANSSEVGSYGTPFVKSNSLDRISVSCLCFMSIVTILLAGALPNGSVDGFVDEEDTGDIAAGEDLGGGEKKIVRVAGPSWSSVRFTVIDIAGLWYLSRGRNFCQTLRAP